MKRKKILAISIVCVLLVGGGSVGGAAYYKPLKPAKPNKLMMRQCHSGCQHDGL